MQIELQPVHTWMQWGMKQGVQELLAFFPHLETFFKFADSINRGMLVLSVVCSYMIKTGGFSLSFSLLCRSFWLV